MIQRLVALVIMAAGAILVGAGGLCTGLALAFMGNAKASIADVLGMVALGAIPIGIGVGVFVVGRAIWRG